MIYILTEHQGTITHADGSADGWQLRVVFPDRESLSQAYDAAREAGFRFEVIAIYGTEDSRQIQYGLTETQRDTLVGAFEAGYFTAPRESSLSEFAEQQNASHQAMSERIRRGVYNLIEQTLITGVRTDQEDE